VFSQSGVPPLNMAPSLCILDSPKVAGKKKMKNLPTRAKKLPLRGNRPFAPSFSPGLFEMGPLNMGMPPFGVPPHGLVPSNVAQGSGKMSFFPSGVNGGPPPIDMPHPNAASSFDMPSNVAQGSGKMPSLPLVSSLPAVSQSSSSGGGAPSFRDAMRGMAQQFSLQSTVSPPGVRSVALQDMPFSLPGGEKEPADEQADDSSM